jgi:hypothetical protein
VFHDQEEKMSLKRFSAASLIGLVTVAAALAPSAAGEREGQRTYRVTITDLTGGQPLTPPVVATHGGKHELFEVGQPASVGVREIAENGHNAPLLAFLEADPFNRISAFEQAGDRPLVPARRPGSAMFPDRVTFEINSRPSARRLSFVSMLICTNDGFTGVDSLRLPARRDRTVEAETQAYDAHTELNTEDFADIVPPCQALIGVGSGEAGSGVSDPAIAEGGVIAHHAGIVGGSDLVPEVHGWTNPVASIAVTRIG